MRVDPAEVSEMYRYLAQEYGERVVVCDNCGAVLKEGSEYFETEEGCLCEGCFDDWKYKIRRYV